MTRAGGCRTFDPAAKVACRRAFHWAFRGTGKDSDAIMGEAETVLAAASPFDARRARKLQRSRRKDGLCFSSESTTRNFLETRQRRLSCGAQHHSRNGACHSYSYVSSR